MVEAIKKIFLELGADVCGVANVTAFDGAPEGFRPTDIYPACKSVIVFAKPLPKGSVVVNPRIVYERFNEMGKIELDRIAYHAASRIEATYRDAVVVPIPGDNPYDSWNPEKMEGRGLISMKHAAALAGIGTIGKSTLLLNRRYGNLLGLGAVLTNLDLPTDPPAETVCLKNCRVCIDQCPVHAISEHGVNQQLCRKQAYGTNSRGFSVVNCNKCRAACPRVFGCEG